MAGRGYVDSRSPVSSPARCSAPRRRASGRFLGGRAADRDLVEWDYGRFEGMLTKNILKQRPGWELFRDGCPEGESPGRRLGPTGSSHVCGAARATCWRSRGAHHPDDRSPLARPAAAGRKVLLLPPRQRGRRF